MSASNRYSAPVAFGRIAEGTLFTYFITKDDLLNHLYLEIKLELCEVMLASLPQSGNPKERLHIVWHKYVKWGIDFPAKRKALAQLGVSDRITEQSKAVGRRAFTDFHALLLESIAAAELRVVTPSFVGAIMGSLAETTMDYMIREPSQAEQYADAGFQAFWNAIAGPE